MSQNHQWLHSIFSNERFGVILNLHFFTVLLKAAAEVCLSCYKVEIHIGNLWSFASFFKPVSCLFLYTLGILFNLGGTSTFVVPYFECQSLMPHCHLEASSASFPCPDNECKHNIWQTGCGQDLDRGLIRMTKKCDLGYMFHCPGHIHYSYKS